MSALEGNFIVPIVVLLLVAIGLRCRRAVWDRRARSLTGWRVHEEVGPDGAVHVWPNVDLIIHDLDGIDCICAPVVEYESDARLVSHNRVGPIPKERE